MSSQTTLATRLKAMREARGLTQGQLARQSGLATVTVVSFELGRRDLRRANYQTLAALAAALGVGVGELAGE